MRPPGRNPSSAKAPSASERPQRDRTTHPSQTAIYISDEEISDEEGNEEEDDLDDTFQAPQIKPTKPVARRKPLSTSAPRTENEEEDEREETPHRDDDGLLESNYKNEEPATMLPIPENVLGEIAEERVNGVAVHNEISVGSGSESLKRKNTGNHGDRRWKRSRSGEEEEEGEESEEEQVRTRGIRVTFNDGSDASTIQTRVPQASAAKIVQQAASTKNVTGKPAEKKGEKAV
ncbi:hypothetical protein E2P81_ATG10746 [Venturia nashicola]|nr:hypothetical protein E2P81_ATG10746 [Venturia nashicola]